jgi:hypothetical protein
VSDLDNPALEAMLVFCLGFVAAGVGVGASHMAGARREEKSTRLLLRLVVDGTISGGLLFVVTCVFIALIATAAMDT